MNDFTKYPEYRKHPVSGTKRHPLADAQEYILSLYNRHIDAKLVYHNYQRTANIVETTRLLANESGLGEEIMEVAQLAAWFHASGYLFDYVKPFPKSMDLAKGFLTAKQYPPELINRVVAAIEAVHPEGIPESAEEQLLSDATHYQDFGMNHAQIHPLLRLELELMQGRTFSNYEWQQIQLQQLLDVRYFTPYGKREFGPLTAQNLLTQKNKAEKTSVTSGIKKGTEIANLRKFQDLDKRGPNSATQTFFRANYRNHINLSAIADNKANIMISVNAILISVIISILSYQNISETNPVVLLPVVLFLVTGLTSLIFAVLSIRPKVTSPPEGPVPMEEAKRNIVFFGNFVRLDLDQYEEALDAVLRDGELLYGNMARDLYFLGKVLDKKYRYLTLSYNIFMVGFIATVLTFLIAIFF